MQALVLLLLSYAAARVGFHLGRRRRPPTPLRIGQRVMRLVRTRKGNYKPVQGFIRGIVGEWVNVRDLDDGRSTWLRRERIARR